MSIQSSIYVKDGQLVQLDDIIAKFNTFPQQYGGLTFTKDKYGKVTCTMNMDYTGKPVTMPYPIQVDEVHIISNTPVAAKTIRAIQFPFDLSVDEFHNGAIDMHTDLPVTLYQHITLRVRYYNDTHTETHAVMMNAIDKKSVNGIHNGYPFMIYNSDSTHEYPLDISIHGTRLVQAKQVSYNIPIYGYLPDSGTKTDIAYANIISSATHNVFEKTQLITPVWGFDGTSNQMVTSSEQNKKFTQAYSWYSYIPENEHYTASYNDRVEVKYDKEDDKTVNITATVLDVPHANEILIDKSFVISGLVWQRSVRNIINTVCFPCQILASEIKNATVYSISSLVPHETKPNEYTIPNDHLIPVETIEANTPYILIANEDNVQLDIQINGFRKISTLNPVTVKIPIEGDDSKEFEFRISYKRHQISELPDWEPAKFFGIASTTQQGYIAGELARLGPNATVIPGIAYLKIIDKE